MNFEIGQVLYLYTARNGKFNVWEGVVVENKCCEIRKEGSDGEITEWKRDR